jgi:hypothetical protein
MRHVSFLVLVLALALGVSPADLHAAPASIEGAWGGSGIAKIRNRADRIVFRVNFDKIGQSTFRVSAQCSAGDRSYEQTGRVSRVGSNRYRGYVFNAQCNDRGNVSISQSGSRLTVSVSGGRGTANLTLSRR